MVAAYSDEMKLYARNLFLAQRANGSHQYSLNQIVKKIKEEYPDMEQYPDRSTIHRWSKEEGRTGKTWKQIWDQGTIRGIETAKEDLKEIEKEKNAEEAMENRISMLNRRLSLMGYDMMLKGYVPVKDPDYEPETVDEGLRVQAMGLRIIASQEKQLEQTDDKVVKIIIEPANKAEQKETR